MRRLLVAVLVVVGCEHPQSAQAPRSRINTHVGSYLEKAPAKPTAVYVTPMASALSKVVAFGWRRTNLGETLEGSDKRTTWPHRYQHGSDGAFFKNHRKAKTRPEAYPIGADARTWKPPGSTELYWVILEDGRRIELPKLKWVKTNIGDLL